MKLKEQANDYTAIAREITTKCQTVGLIITQRTCILEGPRTEIKVLKSSRYIKSTVEKIMDEI